VELPRSPAHQLHVRGGEGAGFHVLHITLRAKTPNIKPI